MEEATGDGRIFSQGAPARLPLAHAPGGHRPARRLRRHPGSLGLRQDRRRDAGGRSARVRRRIAPLPARPERSAQAHRPAVARRGLDGCDRARRHDGARDRPGDRRGLSGARAPLRGSTPDRRRGVSRRGAERDLEALVRPRPARRRAPSGQRRQRQLPQRTLDAGGRDLPDPGSAHGAVRDAAAPPHVLHRGLAGAGARHRGHSSLSGCPLPDRRAGRLVRRPGVGAPLVARRARAPVPRTGEDADGPRDGFTRRRSV